MSEYDSEPVRGLPEKLPAGERILWQGSPAWLALGVRAFHLRTVALYCTALIAWRVAVTANHGPVAALYAALALVPLAAGVLALLAGLGFVFARASVYTITDRRVVLRIGVALPMTYNLPYRVIASADLRLFADGTGDIPLDLGTSERVAFAHLWPHARPWRLSRPQPMLRAVPGAAAVAAVLAQAMAAATAPDGAARAVSVSTAPEARPSLARPATA